VGTDRVIDLERRVAGRFTVIWSVFRAHSAAEDEFIWPALKAKQVSLPEGGCSPCHSREDENENLHMVQQQQQQQQQPQRERNNSITVHHIEQEEYEEDHADEERMFNSINELLSHLRSELLKSKSDGSSLERAARGLLDGTKKLMHHLLTHLDKEETHCMPLVVQYLTKSEINDLVGKIMVSLCKWFEDYIQIITLG
jgi:hemerythrin superfamily protein